MNSTGYDKVRVSVCLIGKPNGTRLKEREREKEREKEGERERERERQGERERERKRERQGERERKRERERERERALTKSKVETVIVPGGCTKYIQAADVVWNRPFKGRIEVFYDDWLANGKR